MFIPSSILDVGFYFKLISYVRAKNVRVSVIPVDNEERAKTKNIITALAKYV